MWLHSIFANKAGAKEGIINSMALSGGNNDRQTRLSNINNTVQSEAITRVSFPHQHY